VEPCCAVYIVDNCYRRSTLLVFSVPLSGDEANDVHRGMNFIRQVKDIEAMQIEVYNVHTMYCGIPYDFALYNTRARFVTLI